MDNNTFSILISGRIYGQQQTILFVKKVVEEFLKHDPNTIFYFMNDKTTEQIRTIFEGLNCRTAEDWSNTKISLVITIGGDGTILYTAKEIKRQTPPFISFQKGTLGFLCKFSTEQIPTVVKEAILSKQLLPDDPQFPFIINKTMRLEGQLYSHKKDQEIGPKVCLNQMYISREKSERIILEIYVNHQLLTETAGDGIMVSTPTGSTAYALSAGGPIVQNGVNCIMIVPIAPNSLSFRPICLPSSSVIRVKLSTKSRSSGYISFDGQSTEPFQAEDEIVIKASNNDLVFYEPKGKQMKTPSWMQRLKYFLGWNEVFKSPTCSQLSKGLKKIVQRTESFPSITPQLTKVTGKHSQLL